MKRRNSDLKRTKIEIIPMIDTMFFLLVFFLLSSLSIINLESLGLNLPKEDSAATTKIKKVDSQLTVAIKKDGNVFVNGKPVLPADIGAALIASATEQERKKPGNRNGILTNEAIQKMSVVISAETGVTHGLVVTCIDSARQQGMERFAISVDKSIIPSDK